MSYLYQIEAQFRPRFIFNSSCVRVCLRKGVVFGLRKKQKKKLFFSFSSCLVSFIHSFFLTFYINKMSSKDKKANTALDQSSMPNFNSSWVNYKGKV
jgi:hypothetical protein